MPTPGVPIAQQEEAEKLMLEVGASGVRLKHFERVVRNLLSSSDISVSYSQLPAWPQVSDDDGDDWPFDRLPQEARVLGPNKGQLSDPVRAKRKEDQLRSMLRCILPLLDYTKHQQQQQQSPKDDATSSAAPPTLVDFGGGSGHLSIPLALLLPQYRIICLDLSLRSLDLLHEKAKHVPSTTTRTTAARASFEHSPPSSDPRFRACDNIPNLFTFHGPVESFSSVGCCWNVVLGIALHLCGEATDVALRSCGEAGALALVFCPCCVGKISSSSKNPYVFQATGRNRPTVEYPQSTAFCQAVSTKSTSDTNISIEDDWNALAKAADYGEMPNARTGQGATRRTAKSLLETDRRMFLEAAFGYETAMCKMDPWESSPKNDIVLAWKPPSDVEEQEKRPLPFALQEDSACQRDMETTRRHLFGSSMVAASGSEASNSENGKEDKRGAPEWTLEEEDEVRAKIIQFLEEHPRAMQGNQERAVLIFPPHMGPRKRKIVHGVAEEMGLAHWGVRAAGGNTKSSQSVAVARRYFPL